MREPLGCRSACLKDDPAYASQQTLFDDLGRDLLEHAFEGYNTTVFACESALVFRPQCASCR